MKFEGNDCTINDICEEVWHNVYLNLYFEEYPESDEDLFELFIYYSNSSDIKISSKELLDNRDTIIQFGKEYIERDDSANYDDAVNVMFECIANFEFEDVYIWNPKLREKAKKEAITKLYNKYCK